MTGIILKELQYQINTLDMVINDLNNKKVLGTTVNDLEAVKDLLEDIALDLKHSGKSIIELIK